MNNYLLLKMICKRIYSIGFGNFWYENGVVGDDSAVYYRIFNCSLLLIYGVMTVMEILAAIIGDFPEDEKRDAIAFAVSHSIVMIKMFRVISNKELVKKLIRDLIKVCELHEEDSLMAEKYRIIKINFIIYFITVYGSSSFYVFEGLRKLHNGSHFVTIITYYPSFEDDSFLALITRITTTFILYIMLLTMVISVDGNALANLIIFKYKFITLRGYFEKLKEDFDEMCDTGNPRIATEKFKQRLIEGIVMHKELIRISEVFEEAFGSVLTLQLCISSGTAVTLLLQLALSDQLTFSATMKIFFFMGALFFLLGLFLCNAGEITYEASLLSASIFYCGWHSCPQEYPSMDRKNLGQIVLQATAQAQRPIVMKAFKMVELTHATFLMVMRGTYSIFTLIYAQKE